MSMNLNPHPLLTASSAADILQKSHLGSELTSVRQSLTQTPLIRVSQNFLLTSSALLTSHSIGQRQNTLLDLLGKLGGATSPFLLSQSQGITNREILSMRSKSATGLFSSRDLLSADLYTQAQSSDTSASLAAYLSAVLTPLNMGAHVILEKTVSIMRDEFSALAEVRDASHTHRQNQVDTMNVWSGNLVRASGTNEMFTRKGTKQSREPQRLYYQWESRSKRKQVSPSSLDLAPSKLAEIASSFFVEFLGKIARTLHL